MQLSEDFARWRDDPFTKLVLKALRQAAETQKEDWLAASWGGAMVRGDDLERKLLVTQTRADAYRSLEEMTPSDIATWLGIEDAE